MIVPLVIQLFPLHVVVFVEYKIYLISYQKGISSSSSSSSSLFLVLYNTSDINIIIAYIHYVHRTYNREIERVNK